MTNPATPTATACCPLCRRPYATETEWPVSGAFCHVTRMRRESMSFQFYSYESCRTHAILVAALVAPVVEAAEEWRDSRAQRRPARLRGRRDAGRPAPARWRVVKRASSAWCDNVRCGNREHHFAGSECEPFKLSPGECECRRPARYGTLPDPKCRACGGSGYLKRRRS